MKVICIFDDAVRGATFVKNVKVFQGSQHTFSVNTSQGFVTLFKMYRFLYDSCVYTFDCMALFFFFPFHEGAVGSLCKDVKTLSWSFRETSFFMIPSIDPLLLFLNSCKFYFRNFTYFQYLHVTVELICLNALCIFAHSYIKTIK